MKKKFENWFMFVEVMGKSLVSSFFFDSQCIYVFRSSEFKEIVRVCLNKDPSQRPSAKWLLEEVCYALLRSQKCFLGMYCC